MCCYWEVGPPRSGPGAPEDGTEEARGASLLGVRFQPDHHGRACGPLQHLQPPGARLLLVLIKGGYSQQAFSSFLPKSNNFFFIIATAFPIASAFNELQ